MQVTEARDVIEMNNDKTPGLDSIVLENLKCGGPILTSTVTSIVNYMISEEIIPSQYKGVLIVPTPKWNRDRTFQDNNRGMTLLTVFFKLRENQY